MGRNILQSCGVNFYKIRGVDLFKRKWKCSFCITHGKLNSFIWLESPHLSDRIMLFTLANMRISYPVAQWAIPALSADAICWLKNLTEAWRTLSQSKKYKSQWHFRFLFNIQWMNHNLYWKRKKMIADKKREKKNSLKSLLLNITFPLHKKVLGYPAKWSTCSWLHYYYY